MILGREHRPVLDREGFDRAVIQIDLGDATVARQRFRIYCEAVVLTRNQNATGRQVLDRLIASVVAELELEGLSPCRQTEKLMTETDPEKRHSGRDQVAHILDDLCERLRITRTVGQQHTIDSHFEALLPSRPSRQHGDSRSP